jgi:hypothetical protein
MSVAIYNQTHVIINLCNFGVWRSWLARRVWDAEVGGSSPLTPTTI